MPRPGQAEPVAHQPGLFSTVRNFIRVLVSTLHSRLDLLILELEDTAVRVAYLAISGVIGVLALHGAFFFAMLWLLAACWDTPYRLWVIGGIFLVYLAVGIGFLVYAGRLIAGRSRFLEQTLTELKRDADQLQKAVKKEGTP
jgi:uncharacterized membrane protein YqjE